MLVLKYHNIESETDANSYRRGLSYFERDKVTYLQIDSISSASASFHSEVTGSQYQTYKQKISINNNYGGINIDGQCSCPVGHNCKHIVASCLEFIHRNNSINQNVNNHNTNRQQNDSLNWLSEFATAGTESHSYPHETGNRFISYALQLSDTENELSVKILINQYLKKGGLGKGRRANLSSITDEFENPSYLQAIDKEIALLIESQNDYAWEYETYSLSGELGSLSLSKMLSTGRCHWLTPQNPALEEGKPRKLLLNWQSQSDGKQVLNIKVEQEARALNTHPALYIDTCSHEIGVISDAHFNARQWKMLLNLPPVPAADCAKFSQQLLITCPGSELPPPQKMKLTQLKKPVRPGLFLYAKTNGDSSYHAHFMQLSYHYGAYEIQPLPNEPIYSFIDKDTSISIHRDLFAEQQAVEIIKSAGFQAMQDAQNKNIIFVVNGSGGPVERISRWQHLLQTLLPELESQGWAIEHDPSFQLEFIQINDWNVNIESESENNWFELRFDLEIKGQKVPLLPLITQILATYEPENLPEIITLPLTTDTDNHQYIQIPGKRIRPIFQTLYELYNTESLDEEGKLRLSRFDATRLAELEDNCSDELNWKGGKAMRQLGRKLKNFKGIKKVAPPRSLKATLRDYQQLGFNWLQFLREYEFNGILADDMGLGKTVQTLAHLLKEKERKRMTKPCLILAPTSLMSNWRREAEQFTAKLKVLVLQGAERKQHFDKIDQFDLILSTYPLLVRDQEVLLAHNYHYLILDEAQVIKNPLAKAARVARDIKARHRLCLTGTPMENHLGELWALFDFLMPGCLGSQKSFNHNFRAPIEKHNNDEQRQRLVNRITPFMLRRSKSEVIKELPAKTEIIRSVALDKKQAALYESIRLSMEKKVRNAIKHKGLARSHITILDALLKLRQTCCDPQLLSLAQAKKVKSSAKLEMLMEMLPEMLEEGRRILIFSQFTKMLGIIEQQLKDHNITYTKLTGKTIHREKAIDRFKQGDADVFLISLKAGGVGLNLTEADTVIHYDPWWNPAVENQATDRTHRIGQNKAVFVYKLITENTLEEKIIAMQARKQALADGVYNKKTSGKDMKLTADDLQTLFAPLS
ncbi:DNA/RNA helicases, SNF2 family [hydrothermal vent metagenome]|uniref:DNA/RNA helicases, SNF2 family n=1 Tax=hydrothermal vent metagenome TaxID=652676 RepID=A0A3B0YI76_9ZZZZ